MRLCTRPIDFTVLVGEPPARSLRLLQHRLSLSLPQSVKNGENLGGISVHLLIGLSILGAWGLEGTNDPEFPDFAGQGEEIFRGFYLRCGIISPQ